MKKFMLFALFALACLKTSPAEAQLSRGVFRFSIDVDMLSVAGTQVEQRNGNVSEQTVFGFGPNQHGGARAIGGPTPLGFGFGWGIRPKLLLGGRIGLGLDVRSPDGAADNIRYLDLSLMPNLTFVPVGRRAKLFLTAAPLFQVSREKRGPYDSRLLMGGFGLGIGTFVFVASSVSVDVGFHFEGRFGNYEDDSGGDDERRDLRGLIRLGLSLWT